MKYKKILLVVFFLTLFVFQQAQAGTGVPSNNKSNSSQPILVQANGLPTQVYVTMLRLDIRNGAPLENPITNEYIKCLLEDFAYGCTELYGVSATEYYPYGNNNPVMVDVESDYLPNVLPREMDVRGNPATRVALQAQALAARSIADWKYHANYVNYGYNYIDNSTNNQVFVPYSYKYYAPDDMVRQLISDAITLTNGQFLSYNGESIDAEFSNDINNPTRSGDWTDYLKSVQDPISPSCDSSPVGNGWGMSQKGAIRWSKGNQCAGTGDQPWSVTWSDYRQILVHYYTGIDILNASGTPVAPDNRWNLLKYELPNGATATAGTPFNVNMMLQNTSTTNWADSPVVMGYKWRETDPWADVPATIPSLTKGASSDLTNLLSLSVPVPSDLTDGTYTLRLDLRHQNNANGWFSNGANGGWPDAQIPVTVNGGPTATPIVTSTSTPTISLTSTTLTSTPAAGEWIQLGIWDVGCNTIIDFPPVTASQFKFQMISGGGWDNHISFYGYGSSGAAWLVNGAWQEVNYPTAALDVNEWRETNVFEPAVVSQQRFSVGCNDGEHMSADVYYRVTYGPTPTVQPFPTVTFTPIPTICTKYCFWEQCSSASQSASAKVASLAQGYTFAIGNFDRIADQAALLYRVRDEILNTTEEGRRYTDLYYTHSAEIASIMNSHSEIAEQGLDVIDTLTPNLQALLDGQGSSVAITNGQVQQAQAFLDVILPYASPALQQAIQSERTRRPLENMIDMTMDEAWSYTNGYQLEWLPPISNPNPYSAQQGSEIPVKFTVTDFGGNFVIDESLTLQALDSNGNVVIGPIYVSDNPNNGIKIQGSQYHYNLKTKDLPAGSYALQVIYNW